MGFPSDSTSRTSPLHRLTNAARRVRQQQNAPLMRRAAVSAIEQLEGRRLLAVVASGETAFFFDGTSTYKIEVRGPGAFTFTAAIRPAPPAGQSVAGPTQLGEVPMSVSGGARGNVQYAGGYRTQAGAGGAQLPTFDIYSIHSANTTAQTSLSITQYTVNQNTPSFSAPFASSGGAFITSMGDPGQQLPVNIPVDNGGVFIGGRSLVQAAPVRLIYSLTKNSAIATSEGVSLPSNKSYAPGIYINGLNNKPASMNNLFIAGTITGRVNISGSVNTFYAGNIITGDATNGNLNSTTSGGSGIGAQNFRIGGDLRNLIVQGGIGTMPDAPDAFIPGTDISIGGRVQQIKSGEEFRASIDVGGATGSYTDGSDLIELESRGVTNATNVNVGDAFDNFQLLNRGFANNDTFGAPQILGSYKSDARGVKGQVTISGTINNGGRFVDNADYYGVPLMAGQTINIQGVSLAANAYVAVFDPDNRLIATDRSNQNNELFFNTTFRVTATTAGPLPRRDPAGPAGHARQRRPAVHADDRQAR